MSALHALAATVVAEAEALGLTRSAPALLAASGGVDSTVLLHILATGGFPVTAATVHHGLRPEADAEAASVAAQARALGVPHVLLHADVATGGNLQDAARTARYDALADLALARGAATVVTAHTATDQAETVLMHLVRGAGLRGLAGMPPARDLRPGVRLVRPFLGATRAEVLAYARAADLRWLDDPTNASDRYLRNRIRHAVLPLLEAEGGPATARRIAEAARAARAALHAGPDAALARCTVHSADGPGLALDALRQFDSATRDGVLLDALRAFAPDAPRRRSLLPDVRALLDAPPGRKVVLGPAAVWRDRTCLRVLPHPAPRVAVPVEPGGSAATPWGTLHLGGDPATAPRGASLVRLRRDALRASLVLRTWRPGDRLRPADAAAPRRVADLLTRAGVPPSARSRQFVLCADEHPLWLVGHDLAADVHDPDGVAIWWTPVAGPGRPS